MTKDSRGASFAQLTTMRVGGEAQELFLADSAERLRGALLESISSDEPWLVLGGGSNTIVSDAGFPGRVILVRTEGVAEVADPLLQSGKVRVRVQAGHDWDDFVELWVGFGWVGVEALSGIPGCVGAAPVQNIGAYGTDIKETLHSIEVFDIDTGDAYSVDAEELGLGYRTSAIKRQELNAVVLSVDFVLDRSGDARDALAVIKYDQLARALDCEIGDSRPATQVREAVLNLRRSKGMVLDDSDNDSWSSGSFFMNPIVSESFSRALPANAPRYPVAAGSEDPLVIPLSQEFDFSELQRPEKSERFVKLSAAWLIENSGISRGFRIPGSGAAISSKHTLAITNRGAATAADVAELARFVIARVRSEFGILLIPEPNLYGLEL